MYERFLMLLDEHNVSSYEVAKSTGVSRATLSSWKTGRYQPKLNKLQKIADYFNVSIEWLLGNIDYEAADTTESTSGTGELVSSNRVELVDVQLIQLQSNLRNMFRLLSNKNAATSSGKELDTQSLKLLKNTLKQASNVIDYVYREIK